MLRMKSDRGGRGLQKLSPLPYLLTFIGCSGPIAPFLHAPSLVPFFPQLCKVDLTAKPY